MINRILLVFGTIFLLFSCTKNNTYQKNIDIPKSTWEATDTLKFETKIVNNTPKNMLVNIRHTTAFNWRNVWFNLQIRYPNDSIANTKLNLQLSQPNGQWYGKCSGDICLIQLPVNAFDSYNFEDTGTYTFALSHEMRENPLENIMSVGIKIENSVE